MPLIINLELYNEGGILAIGTSNGKCYGRYAVSPESVDMLVEMIGNIVNFTEPFVGDKFVLPTTGD
jgi:hypothetical protein